MKKYIDTVLFDMDGVLVETEFICLDIIKNMFLENHKVTINDDFANTFPGNAIEKNIASICKKFNLKVNVTEFLSDFDDKLITRLNKDKPIANSGLLELLDYIKANNLKFAVGSSSSRLWMDNTLPHVLNSLGILEDYKDFFAVTISGSDVLNKKPAPDIYNLCLKELNSLAENAIVIEDTFSGIKSAKSANIISVCLNTEYNSFEQISIADYIVNDLSEIINIISNLRED